jgi:hypothetical protein
LRRRRGPRTWAQLFAQRVGVRKAAKVIAFVATYHATQQELGRPPSMEEYAEDWGISRATAFRDLALFREAQPFFDQPAGFIAAVGPVSASAIADDYLAQLGGAT